MKILQISHKPPLPAIDGGCIAINNITQGILKEGHEVKVLSVVTKKHPLQKDKIPEDYFRNTQFESVFINTRVNPIKAFFSLFSEQSYYVERFFSNDFKKQLIAILTKEVFDIIQLESIFVAPYIPVIRKYSQAKIVLRCHNVEHQIWGRFLIQQKNPLKRLFLKKMVRQLKDFEFSVFNHIDAFLAISEPDFRFFRKYFPKIPGAVISAGIDIVGYTPKGYIPSEIPKLFHIGSMNWIPNIEGLDWFFEEVWNAILQRFPDITFTVAGRGIPPSWKSRSIPNVTIVGEVDNANDFICSHDIMIVPLLSGSGVRIKILEGMALEKTIITTPVGAEGLDVENGKNIFIANTSTEFVEAIEQCIKSPDLCRFLGENAREYVMLHHNNAIITQKLIALYQELFEKKGDTPR